MADFRCCCWQAARIGASFVAPTAAAVGISDDGGTTWKVVNIDNGGFKLDAETDVTRVPRMHTQRHGGQRQPLVLATCRNRNDSSSSKVTVRPARRHGRPFARTLVASLSVGGGEMWCPGFSGLLRSGQPVAAEAADQMAHFQYANGGQDTVHRQPAGRYHVVDQRAGGLDCLQHASFDLVEL